jgi:hypothetical protein
MDEILIAGKGQNDAQFYVSELSERTLLDNGISGGSGLYLYEISEELGTYGILVLAEFPNEESAYRMLDILRIKEPV